MTSGFALELLGFPRARFGNEVKTVLDIPSGEISLEEAGL